MAEPAESLQAAKRKLRWEMLSRLRAEGPRLRPTASGQIAGHVAALPAFQRAGTVHIFLSLPEEVDTAPLLKRCLEAGKSILVPVLLDDGTMGAAPWSPGTHLVAGKLGTRQPDARTALPPDEVRPDIVIVPGLAFDRKGGRLGRGKAYYDRALTEIRGAAARAGRPPPPAVAIGFGLQLVSEVPMQPRDVRVDAVITETEQALIAL